MDKGFLEDCLAEGMSLEVIGELVGKHPSTVGYWLRKFELKPIFGRRRRRSVTDGPRFAIFECRHHGMTEFVLEGRGYYRCKRCRSRGVAERRRVVKRKLVEEAGGACLICGYDRCFAALEFHHLDPSEKEFSLSLRGITKSIEVIRREAAKCVLLCATCHAEVEAGFTDIPTRALLGASA